MAVAPQISFLNKTDLRGVGTRRICVGGMVAGLAPQPDILHACGKGFLDDDAQGGLGNVTRRWIWTMPVSLVGGEVAGAG